jgi:HK97 gp10 family phage protein
VARPSRETFHVSIQGIQELDKKLREMPFRLKGHSLRKAVEKGADVLEREMIVRAKRRSGNLAMNIETGKSRVRKDGSVAEVSVGPNKKAWYGRWVELGSRFMKAQPFMRPALRSKAADIVNAIRQELAVRLMKYGVS